MQPVQDPYPGAPALDPEQIAAPSSLTRLCPYRERAQLLADAVLFHRIALAQLAAGSGDQRHLSIAIDKAVALLDFDRADDRPGAHSHAWDAQPLAYVQACWAERDGA